MHVERETGLAEWDGLTRQRRGTMPFFLSVSVRTLCRLFSRGPTALSLQRLSDGGLRCLPIGRFPLCYCLCTADKALGWSSKHQAQPTAALARRCSHK